jgi:hypothetical protein
VSSLYGRDTIRQIAEAVGRRIEHRKFVNAHLSPASYFDCIGQVRSHDEARKIAAVYRPVAGWSGTKMEFA